MYPFIFQYGDHRLSSYIFCFYIIMGLCAIGWSLESERLGWKVPPVFFFLRWLPQSWQESRWFEGAWISTSAVGLGIAGASIVPGAIGILADGLRGHLPAFRISLFSRLFHEKIYFAGMFFSMVYLWYLARRNKVPVLQIYDTAAILSALGQAPARVGCFLGGCCFGKPTNLLWGIAFDSNHSLKEFPRGTHLHPSQAYEFIVALVLFIYMWRKRKTNTYDGQSLVRCLVLVGLARFATEFFRADTPRSLISIWPWMSASQAVGLGMAVGGLILRLTRADARLAIRRAWLRLQPES